MNQDAIGAASAPMHAPQAAKNAKPRKANRPVGTVHRVLRTATRDDHASIDRMLLRFDLNRLDDYRIFLTIHFNALSALRAEWRPEDRADFSQMLDCLRADLKALGGTPVSSDIAQAQPPSMPRGMGIAYVVRGSRLGTAVLRRDMMGELPTTYLDFAPLLTWSAFLEALESIADIEHAKQDAARSARSAFGVFASEYSRLLSAIPARKRPESKAFSSMLHSSPEL